MIGHTLRAVQGLNAELRTLFATTLVFRAGTMAYPFLSAYLLLPGDLGVRQVGLVVSSYGAGALGADVAAGAVLARIGPKATMLCGLCGQVIVLLATPFLTESAALVPAVLLWGFAYELFTPASYSATVARSGHAERKVAFSCNRLAINLGMGVGPAIGGLVFAVNPTALFWTNAGFVLAAAAVLLTIGTSAERIRDGDTVVSGRRRRHRWIAGTLREETRFWVAFGLSLPVQLAFSLPLVFAGVYVIGVLGLPGYWVGVVFTVNAVVIVLFEVPLNSMTAGWSHARTLRVGYLLTGSGFLIMGLAESGAVLVAATLVWTVGEMVVFPGLLTYVSALSAPEMSNRNLSFYSGGVNIAFITAPQISLLLSTDGRPALPWFVMGAAVLFALILLLVAPTSSYTWFRPSTGADDASIRRTV